VLPGTYFGTPTRLTATGTVCITSANACILGIAFQGTGTGFLTLFAGVTSTAPATLLGVVRAFTTVGGATANQALYFPFPAYCPSGITTIVGATADPSITLFWNPVGGP
jgi:hypothetical protein